MRLSPSYFVILRANLLRHDVADEQVLRVLWYCMSYGNSCANPIIYNYASTDFRAGFRRTVRRLLVCLPKQPGGCSEGGSEGGVVIAAEDGTRNRVMLNTAVRMSPRLPTAMSAVRV